MSNLQHAAYREGYETAAAERNATIASLQAELVALREALKPSAETKAAYIGEFKFPYTVWDPNGEHEITHQVTVPWTTVKEIMKAIVARAALGGDDATR